MTSTGSLLEVQQVEAKGSAFHLGPLSFSVDAGQTLAIVGRSGAGKTLLLRTLVGLAPLHAGSLRVANVEVGAEPPAPNTLRDLRNQVGMSFQRGALLDDESVFENVRLANLDGEDGDVVRALRAVGLEQASNKLPGALSGGMRRRVGLARALVNAASVLLCDDVTAGLDPSTGASAFDEIFEVSRQRRIALVVTTHDVDVVLPRADVVLVLDAGACVYLGPPSEMPASDAALAFAPLGAKGAA